MIRHTSPSKIKNKNHRLVKVFIKFVANQIKNEKVFFSFNVQFAAFYGM